MQYTALFVIISVSHALSIGALLLVFWRTEKFMTKAMVYMKSNSIHEVMTAGALLQDQPKQEEEAIEVVNGDDAETEILLMKTQEKHRNRHLNSLGSDVILT